MRSLAEPAAECLDMFIGMALHHCGYLAMMVALFGGALHDAMRLEKYWPTMGDGICVGGNCSEMRLWNRNQFSLVVSWFQGVYVSTWQTCMKIKSFIQSTGHKSTVHWLRNSLEPVPVVKVHQTGNPNPRYPRVLMHGQYRHHFLTFLLRNLTKGWLAKEHETSGTF